jgi:hypothetical protein
MSEWQGFDSGGVEEIWPPEVLREGLEIFKAHEPSSRTDPDSPIFDDLEDRFPEVTWRPVKPNPRDFRPIFRRNNPWVKLGLIDDHPRKVYVTELGDELLQNEKSLAEVCTEAAKAYRESDGTPSFGIMCRAALEAPDVEFRLEDVEFGVSKGYADGTESLAEALKRIRTKGIAFPKLSRRPRTLRTFLNLLVTAGALVTTSTGWALGDPVVASEVAQDLLMAASGAFPAEGIATTEPIPKPGKGTKKAVAPAKGSSNRREIKPGNRPSSIFTANINKEPDPQKRALLLEKANSIHEHLVERAAIEIRNAGLTPIEDPNSFDAATSSGTAMIEVKSINKINAISQIRKAVAQLPEYRWRSKDQFDANTKLIILTNENPEPFIGSDLVQYLKEDRKLELFWEDGKSIVNKAGDKLGDWLR